VTADPGDDDGAVERARSLGPRAVTVGALAALTATYVSILYRAVNVAGDPALFAAVVVGALAAGVVLGWLLPESLSLPLTIAVATAGMVLYLPTVPDGWELLGRFDVLWRDVVALLTGLSVLRIINAGVWATAFAPVPVFLSWFLAARKRYSLAAAVGTATLVFLILTGDASARIALFGAIAAATAVGVGDVDLRGGRLADADGVAVVVAAMVVLTASVTLVPTGAGEPLLDTGGGEAETVEASLTRTDGELSIQGSISLSPEVRYRVESEEGRYWKIGSYDRYSGDSWVRTAGSDGFDGQSGPPGETRPLRQRFTVESATDAMPAAWKPVSVDGHAADVTGYGSLRPPSRLRAGEEYEVTSRISNARPAELREAGDDYSAIAEERFTQLPSSTPDQVTEFTSTLTANADNAYDTARVIEVYLQEEKEYSLNVSRPSGDIAANYLFEMEAGYCTYFATTMATMLRSQDIPARIAVGYTSGQQVGDDEWVVRGLDAHMWVEVYFPGHGWQRFDPTPAGPRQEAEQQRIEDARNEGNTDVDVEGTTPTPTPTPETDDDPATETPNATPPNTSGLPGGPTGQATPPGGPADGSAADGASDGGGGIQVSLPSREEAALGGIVLLGVAAAVRRSGAGRRLYREVWLRRQPTSDSPARDIQQAFERVEYLLGRHRRTRDPGETPRRYLRSLGDAEARRVGELYEKAVYAGRATPEDADEARALVADLVDRYGRL
jgi:transglutaminase-like putative cysteine protease